MMINDFGSVDTEDEEVNCVFCGKLFPSIERVQEHITQTHESLETTADNVEIKLENVGESKLRRVYDLNTELIVNRVVDYHTVVQCSKCDLLFVNAYASRIHFEKVHLGRKRKRSSNPNGVEGIIVSPNGSDDWSCDICGRQFPTLKQAKVHKFKSHIEPLQKKKTMIHRNLLRKNSVSQRHYVKKLIAENKFREILPNSKKPKIDKSLNELSQHGNIDGENSSHSDHNTQGSHSASGTGRPATNLWRAAQTSSRGNKIVISRVYQSDVLLAGVARSRYGFLQKSGFSCFYCREIFINKESFRRHLLLHWGSRFYKCRNCGSKFKRIRMLKQHQRLNCHIQFVKNCGTSETNGPTTTKLEVNKILPKSVERGTLTIIKTESLAPKSVIVQVKDEDIAPKDIKFAEKFLNNSGITLNKGSQCVCNLCQSCFYSNNSILRHLVLYHRIAAQDGSTALSTTLHSRTVHAPQKLKPLKCSATTEPCNQNNKPSLHFIHNCDHCDSQFASKKGLQRHLHSVHVISSQRDSLKHELACSECSRSFSDSRSFEFHKEECSGWSSSPGGNSRRVKCDICGRRFRNPLTLEEHRRMHGDALNSENLKDEAARVSEKMKSRDGFVGGRKTMSYTVPAYKKAKVPPNSDGLFECDVCHKTFTCRSSLSNHVKSHFNFKNKPFSCSSCKQGFMSTLTLQHHREQLCPNISVNCVSNSHGDATNSAVTSGDPVPQSPLFSSYDSVSHIQGTSSPSLYSGNSNTTNRATSCMHCSAMFPDRSLLEDHASKEHSNHAGEVVCIICPRSFTTYMAFRVHMTKSHGGPNGTSLKSHQNTTNSGSKAGANFELIPLSMSLSSEDLCVSAVFPNGKMFHSRHACPNCDKDFSTSQALGNHKRACMPHLYKKVSL